MVLSDEARVKSQGPNPGKQQGEDREAETWDNTGTESKVSGSGKEGRGLSLESLRTY